MARSAEDFPPSSVVVSNPADEVTAEAFAAWLGELEDTDPLELPVSAADTLAEIRAAGGV